MFLHDKVKMNEKTEVQGEIKWEVIFLVTIQRIDCSSLRNMSHSVVYQETLQMMVTACVTRANFNHVLRKTQSSSLQPHPLDFSLSASQEPSRRLCGDTHPPPPTHAVSCTESLLSSEACSGFRHVCDLKVGPKKPSS